MTPQEFDRLIKKKAKEIQTYVVTRFPAQAGDTALRFINGNFRAQGYQGTTFKKWKTNQRNGTILVQKGHLRSANYYVTGNGIVMIRNSRPYAKIHNEGGDIEVTPKMRKFFWAMYYKESGKGIKKSKSGAQYQSIEVGKRANRWRNMAFAKKIHISQRQFAPLPGESNPILNNAITRKIDQELQRIFNS